LNVWKLCVARPAFWVSVWCMAFLVLSVFLRHLWWFVCTKMGSEVNDISFLRSSSEKSSASLSQYKKKKTLQILWFSQKAGIYAGTTDHRTDQSWRAPTWAARAEVVWCLSSRF
jgi:hypothetical protein